MPRTVSGGLGFGIFPDAGIEAPGRHLKTRDRDGANLGLSSPFLWFHFLYQPLFALGFVGARPTWLGLPLVEEQPFEAEATTSCDTFIGIKAQEPP